jgi:cupin superfamily acireductone dioxygenase involved in methionine salvage
MSMLTLFLQLHWHKTAEWAYVLSGHVQISSVDQNGRNYLATVVNSLRLTAHHPMITENWQKEGDLWYFPPGVPHSLQATDANPAGGELARVYFSRQSTESL